MTGQREEIINAEWIRPWKRWSLHILESINNQEGLPKEPDNELSNAQSCLWN